MGRARSRAWCRRAAAMFWRPRRVIAVLRRLAMTRGALPSGDVADPVHGILDFTVRLHSCGQELGGCGAGVLAGDQVAAG
jgi:hypothetical protein